METLTPPFMFLAKILKGKIINPWEALIQKQTILLRMTSRQKLNCFQGTGSP
jgi:hypothetical protein